MLLNKTLLLGLGNDLRGDDGIAFTIVEDIKNRLCGMNTVHEIDIENSICSGINLLSYLVKYRNIIIVDSVVSDSEVDSPGFWKLRADEIENRTDIGIRTAHGIGIHNLLGIVNCLYSEQKKQILLFLVGIKKGNEDYAHYVNTSISDNLLRLVPAISASIMQEIIKGENIAG